MISKSLPVCLCQLPFDPVSEVRNQLRCRYYALVTSEERKYCNMLDWSNAAQKQSRTLVNTQLTHIKHNSSRVFQRIRQATACSSSSAKSDLLSLLIVPYCDGSQQVVQHEQPGGPSRGGGLWGPG